MVKNKKTKLTSRFTVSDRFSRAGCVSFVMLLNQVLHQFPFLLLEFRLVLYVMNLTGYWEKICLNATPKIQYGIVTTNEHILGVEKDASCLQHLERTIKGGNFINHP